MGDAPTRVRGDGRIFRHPKSRFWHMAFFVNGKEYRESTYETDQRKATKKLRQRQAETDRGEFAPKGSKLTVGELLELVQLDYEKKRNRSAGNLVWLRRHLLDHFDARMRARNVTSSMVDAYIVERRKEGAADSTIRQEVHILDRGFKLAVSKRMLPSASRPFIENVTVGDSNARQGFVLREEIEGIAANLVAMKRPDYADFVLFLFHCTWRSDEVRTLTWRDYDKQENGFRLRREEDKAKRGRLIPMAGELSAIMKRRLAVRRLDCPFVFHRNGRPIGDIRKTWDKACAKAGVAHRLLHDLRRSGIKHLRNAGVAEQTIMRLSGHRTNATFSRYSVFSNDDLRDALDRGSATAGDKSTVLSVDRTIKGAKE